MKEKIAVRRLLLDLNILLDVVLDRTEAAKASRIWALLEAGRGQGFVGSPVKVIDAVTAVALITAE